MSLNLRLLSTLNLSVESVKEKEPLGRFRSLPVKQDAYRAILAESMPNWLPFMSQLDAWAVKKVTQPQKFEVVSQEFDSCEVYTCSEFQRGLKGRH